MALGTVIPHRIKNAIAKIFVVAWIAYLIFAVYALVFFAVSFDVSAWFGLSGDRALPDTVVTELRLVIVMLAASLTGGIVYMIRDFYQSIKYSNIYDRAYDDYRARMMGISEFQRIVTLQVYLGRFNYTWTFWFLLQPVMSGVLGVVAYAIARSGLASILGAATEELSVRSLYLYIVFSFLSGFASHKFIAWLDRFAESVFKAPALQQYRDTKQAIETMTAADRMDLRGEVAGASHAAGESAMSSPSEAGMPNIEAVSDVELRKAVCDTKPAASPAEPTYGLKAVR